MLNNKRLIRLCFCLFFFCMASKVSAQLTVNALVDTRLVSSNEAVSWLNEGLGKQRFDTDHQGLTLGQLIAVANYRVEDTLSINVAANMYSDRKNLADISEAYVSWKPVPTSSWRIKTKMGAFFPAISLENTGLGWTNPWMISSSAINTWLGEELRTLGGEVTVSHQGMFEASPHDIELVVASFKANDPAGALLAWRGWSLGDRITGLTERILLPDIPTYAEGGQLARQVNWEEIGHEIDGRAGYYYGLGYSYAGWLKVKAYHYDNRGNPLVQQKGQYAWDTQFDSVSFKVELPQDWTVMGQFMDGYTAMGRIARGAVLDFQAYYGLLSKRLGDHRITVRFDRFSTTDLDKTLHDNNNETGNAVAVCWSFQATEASQWGVEYLRISSHRPERAYLDEEYGGGLYAGNLAETTVQAFFRYKF